MIEHAENVFISYSFHTEGTSIQGLQGQIQLHQKSETFKWL